MRTTRGRVRKIYKECRKINARFEFAAIFASSCWQLWKKNSLTAESLRLVKMARYTIQQCIFIIEQYFKNSLLYLIQILR